MIWTDLISIKEIIKNIFDSGIENIKLISFKLDSFDDFEIYQELDMI